jgi:D-alanyl-D-alanine dipeptidase
VYNRLALSAPRFLLALAASLFIYLGALPAQSVNAASETSRAPGSPPPDAPLAWKQLVGIYAPDKHSEIIILERDEKLFWLVNKATSAILPDGNNEKHFSVSNGSEFTITMDSAGLVREIKASDKQKPLLRADAGSDPAHFYHVTPVRPLAEIRAEAVRASPPAEAGPFREPDLVELVTLDPAFHLDIRYAQSNNFLSTPSYTEARAFMQRPAAEALLRALNTLNPLGYGLLVHDAYRPWYVTKVFWDATPPAGHSFVADPQKGSKHNRGCAVDITLYELSTGKAIEMPGLYDEMLQRSFPDFPGGTSLQRWHRDLLRHAIESEGFTVDGNEWWHYDYKDWKQYPIMNTPFEKLGKG